MAFYRCQTTMGMFGINTNVDAMDVGGARVVVLDDKWDDNPLLRISPGLVFLDAGFLDDENFDMKVDFLNFEDIEWMKDAYDLVYCFDTLEHVPDPFKWSRHLIYTCKPGGFVYLSTVFLFPYHPSPLDYFRFSPEGLRVLFDPLACEIWACDWEDETRHSSYILVRKENA